MTSLDAAAIRASLQQQPALALDRLDVFPDIDSTNTYLKDQPSPPPGQIRVVVADHQTAGRGRHDRQWHSAPGASLCLSLSCRLRKTSPELPALTLAIGIGLADALVAMGVAGIQLKWPNDLLVGNAKLGGILTETRFRGSDDATVIVGIGINVQPGSVPEESSTWVNSATCLADVMQDAPSCEQLAAVVIESLVSTLHEFEAHGFTNSMSRFADYDWLHGKIVSVDSGDGEINGIAAGISDGNGNGDAGALLIDTPAGQRKVHAGSVRLAEAGQ